VQEVRLIFGDDFAHAIEAATPGQWTGPVESAYGLHLVLVTARLPASRPDLTAVRPQVERELTAERRGAALDSLYRRLLAKYSVVVEKQNPPRVTGAASAGSHR
jgi:parvulin-like peptidyl-prolyl isomerase